METLILMRHSYAASNNPAWSDAERPLTQAGRDLTVRTARLLQEFAPDRIVCSSATRTVETAELIQQEMPGTPIDRDDDLYLAPAHLYLTAALSHANEEENTVLMIGHNPGISALINSWSSAPLAISPATVAIFRASGDDWKQLTSGNYFSPELLAFISEGGRIS